MRFNLGGYLTAILIIALDEDMRRQATVLLCLCLPITIIVAMLARYANCLAEFRVGAGLQHWGLGPFALPLAIVFTILAYIAVVAISSRVLSVSQRLRDIVYGGVVLAMIFPVMIFALGKSPAQCYLQGFRLRIQQHITAGAFADWRRALMPLTGEPTSSHELPTNEYPSFISSLDGRFKPRLLVVFDERGRSSYAMIMWGGGFRTYGIVVDLNGRYSQSSTPAYFEQVFESAYVFVG
jgi:hypothetical protein